MPENHYFILSDNRNDSIDSYMGWTITGKKIIGKACLRVRPLDGRSWAGIHSTRSSLPVNRQQRYSQTRTTAQGGV